MPKKKPSSGTLKAVFSLEGPAAKVWLGCAIATALLTLGAAVFPVYPGDVALTRVLQDATPENIAWAERVSDTARQPGRYVLLAAAMAIGWALYHWQAAMAAAVAFFTLIGFDLVGKPLFGRPRPTEELVTVPVQHSGYSFPSTFAMVYVTTFGFAALLLAMSPRGGVRVSGLVLCAACLLVGAAARVVLGGHWPSDMLICYLIGFLWLSFLVRVSDRLQERGTELPPSRSPAP